MKKKQAITLIEMMIVIVLIGLIGGALAFNMRGSLEKGKVFKTEQNILRVYDILMLEHAQRDIPLTKILEEREDILKRSSLVKDGPKLLKDAWGNDLIFTVQNDDIAITYTRARASNTPHP